MRRFISIIALFVLCALMMIVIGQAQGDGVRRITPAEARGIVAKGQAVIVDVRGEDSYKAGHIKDALWIPLNDISSRAGELPRGKMIITYCSWPAEHTSARAVQIMKEKGLENGAALLGGYDAWVKAGYPTEKKWWVMSDEWWVKNSFFYSALITHHSSLLLMEVYWMRLLFSMTAAVVLATLMLAACNSTDNSGNRASGGAGSNSSGATTPLSTSSPGHVAPSDGVKRVTTIELRDALEKGTAIVVDVRGAASYQQNHIKGSISIPLEEVGARMGELPRDKMIVTYCSWPSEHTSARAAQMMQEKGIHNVAALLGGTQAWMDAKLPMETGN
jgi:rhodanese-related sulfurtransferase/predicted small secreted protein